MCNVDVKIKKIKFVLKVVVYDSDCGKGLLIDIGFVYGYILEMLKIVFF